MNFTINLTFSNPSGNELGILGTEIEDENLVEKSPLLHFLYIQIKKRLGKRVKRIGKLLSVSIDIFRPLIRIDRRPLCDKRGHSSVEVLLLSILQGEKDIVPFPRSRFLKHS